MEMSNEWFFQDEKGETSDPITLEDLTLRWTKEDINEKTLVKCSSMISWTSIQEYPKLNSYLKTNEDSNKILIEREQSSEPPVQEHKVADCPKVLKLSARTRSNMLKQPANQSSGDNEDINHHVSLSYSDNDNLPCTSTDEDHAHDDLFAGDGSILQPQEEDNKMSTPKNKEGDLISSQISGEGHIEGIKDQPIAKETEQASTQKIDPIQAVKIDEKQIREESIDSRTTSYSRQSDRSLRIEGADSAISSPLPSDRVEKCREGSLNNAEEMREKFEVFMQQKGFNAGAQERLRAQPDSQKRLILHQEKLYSLGGKFVKEDSIKEGECSVTIDKKMLGKHKISTRKYLCVLLKDRLHLYHNVTDTGVAEEILLCKKSRVFSNPEHTIPYTFVIVSKKGNKPNREYLFHCSSPREKNLWMESILKVAAKILDADGSIDTKHVAFELTSDMMHGLRHTISRLEVRQEKNILEAKDMSDIEKLAFPAKGSATTRGHKMNDFNFKTYAPQVFRKIRKKFGVDSTEFLMQCANDKYMEFSSNSKSGEWFFFSENKKYMIKTISQGECRCLRAFLPSYYRHVMSNTNTLINRFYGLYRIKPSNALSRTVWFLIMGSVFPSHLKISRLYDLKGSRYGRQASKADQEKGSCVYKDNDFLRHGIKIDVGDEMAEKLKKQVEKDVSLLVGQKIIDYSMLVGIHYVDAPKKKKVTTTTTTTATTTTTVDINTISTTVTTDIDTTITTTTTTDPTLSSFIADNREPQMEITQWVNSFQNLSKNLSNFQTSSETEICQMPKEKFMEMAENNPLAGLLYNHLQKTKSKKLMVNSSNNHVFSPSASPIIPSEHALRTFVDETPSYSFGEKSFTNQYGGIPSKNGDIVYFLGIIDTLIVYGLKKKVETHYKSTVLPVERNDISVVPPKTYGKRFNTFMKKGIC